MLEVTDSGENHRHVAVVCSGDDFIVANRSAGLNRAGCASIGRGQESVWKWKKSKPHRLEVCATD
jgi:hypothetical protein